MSSKVTPPPLGQVVREPDTITPDGSEIRLLATEAQGTTRASRGHTLGD